MGLARRMAFTAIKMVAVKAGAFCQHGLERPLGAELAIVAAGRSGTNPHRWSRTTDRHSPVFMQAAIQGCLVARGRALDRGGTTAASCINQENCRPSWPLEQSQPWMLGTTFWPKRC